MQLRRVSHLPDWTSLAVAALLFMSPWALHYTSVMATIATCFSAVILVILSGMAIEEVDPTEEPEYFIVGVLLLVSPWILGFWTELAALLVHSVFGALLIIHAAWVFSRENSSESKRGS
ncbi:MAG: SPW repeat protein [Methylocystis sp.]|nr:SPW repeat protein [Methylocystis sp.]